MVRKVQVTTNIELKREVLVSLDDLKSRLSQAYANFVTKVPDEERQKVEALLQQAHNDATGLLDQSRAHMEGHELAHVWSMLQKDVPPLDEAKARAPLPYVTPSGEIVGFGKFEQLDPEWAEAAVEWLEHYCDRHPFVTNPATITIPDTVTIALAGDWGTGNWKTNAPSQKVAAAMRARNPDYTIHLGDVYYAGTKDEETQNFVAIWPQGSKGSFALNSNHEMYAGGFGYYDVALQNGMFKAQNGTSYFVLENNHWLIVGLDSAYDADEAGLYQDGKLNDTQIAFLKGVAAKASQENKKVIALSHHQGLDLKGTPKDPLWSQVTGALGGSLACWYWGHIHSCAVYQPNNGVLGRCCGHAAIPYGDAAELEGNTTVVWRETQSANDPDIPLRILNGFALLTLDGGKLSEAFIDENNQTKWPG